MPFVLSTPRGPKAKPRGAQKGLPPAKKQVPKRELPALKAAAKAATPKKEIDKTAALNDLFNKRLKQEQAATAGDPEAYKKATKEFKLAHGKLATAGVLGPPKKGVLKFAGQFVDDIANAAIYSPYGGYKLGEAMAKDEYYGLQGKTSSHTTDFLKAVGKAQIETVKHPLRHPGDTALLGLAAVTGGASLGSRISAAGEAARAASAIGKASELTKAVEKIPEVKNLKVMRPAKNPDSLSVVAKGRGNRNVGHITAHRQEDGNWQVTNIHVPEEHRLKGIGNVLFRKAEQEVGKGKLLHQTQQDLLSPEGAAFARATPPGTSPLRAALTRPSHEGGSLLKRPAPRESQLIWRGGPEPGAETRATQIGKSAMEGQMEMPLGELGKATTPRTAVGITRLEPDNPIMRMGHRIRNRVLQKQLDTLADGGKLSPVHEHWITKELLGMHGPTVVGREARALRRVAPELADTVEAQIPKEWIKKLNPGPTGSGIRELRKFTNQVRFFGVYLGPKYVTTNLPGNILMGASTQGVTRIAANMARARRMMTTHGEELTRTIEHDMGLSRTESYLSEALKGEEGAGLTHTGKIRNWQDRWTKKMMDITDVDFRRASWQYRAREAGFNTVEEQRRLIEDPALAQKRAAVARRARKDAVDFDSLTPGEKQIAEGVFFYPWMSRATSWTARSVLNRPIKSAAGVALAQQGKAASDRELGKLPEWAQGSIKTPLGVVSAKSVFAPSTVGDIIQSGRHVVKGALGLEKGNVHSFFQEFGTPPAEILSGGSTLPQLGQTLLPISTYVRAGSPFGQIPGTHQPKSFPKTGWKEAALPTILGSLFPRQPDMKVIHEQAKREEMLATSPMQHIGMRIDERISKIPAQVKLMTKAGAKPSQSDIASYKGDLDALKHRDEFRLSYAQDKGKNAYRDLDPKDKAEAAIQYLDSFTGTDTDTINQLHASLNSVPKSQLNYLAKAYWDMTGIGVVKSNWDYMVKAYGG